MRGWTATSRTHQSIAIRKSIFQRIVYPEIDGYDEIHSIKTSSVHQNMRRKPRKVIHIQKMHNGKIEDRTTKIENDARRKEVIIRKIGQPIMTESTSKLQRLPGDCVRGRSVVKSRAPSRANICDHGRARTNCKVCGGASICAHVRRRSQCKECGGASICEHGRQHHTCRQCGGASICDHGRHRYRCKDCAGASICAHGRRRSQCKECVVYSSVIFDVFYCCISIFISAFITRIDDEYSS